jgi:hypothetical protein
MLDDRSSIKTKRHTELRAGVPFSMIDHRSSVIEQLLAIEILLCLANLALGLALEILRLALELLARIAGQSADRVPELALGLLAEALGLVLEAIGVEIVCHLTAPK